MEWGNLDGLWRSSKRGGFILNLKMLGIVDDGFKARVQGIEGDSMVQVDTIFRNTSHLLRVVFPRRPGVLLFVTECETPTITKGCMIRGNARKVSNE